MNALDHHPTRRGLLIGAGALAALASVSGAGALAWSPRRKLVVVVAPGGWDPTLVLAPSRAVVRGDPGRVASAGGIDFVDHRDRPSVRAFFEQEHGRTLIVRGLPVPRAAHDGAFVTSVAGRRDPEDVPRSLATDADEAVVALARGASRVTLSSGDHRDWDTHEDSDARQSVLWEDLFAGLTGLMDALDAAPGSRAPTLAAETCVAVVSEMGRAPTLNAAGGRDHWPYTSAMLVGAGFVGDRAIGGYDHRLCGDGTVGALAATVAAAVA